MGLSLFGNSGDKTQISNQYTTNNTDSFNQTYSSVRSWSDVGNTVFQYGMPAQGAAGVVTSMGPYLVAVALVVAGAFLLSRR